MRARNSPAGKGAGSCARRPRPAQARSPTQRRHKPRGRVVAAIDAAWSLRDTPRQPRVSDDVRRALSAAGEYVRQLISDTMVPAALTRVSRSLDRDRLRKVAGLVHVGAANHG